MKQELENPLLLMQLVCLLVAVVQQNLFDMEQKKAEIEGLFYVEDDKHPCIAKAEELDIEIEDGMIILKRDIAANGKVSVV